jgi:hypothetical protein
MADRSRPRAFAARLTVPTGWGEANLQSNLKFLFTGVLRQITSIIRPEGDPLPLIAE